MHEQRQRTHGDTPRTTPPARPAAPRPAIGAARVLPDRPLQDALAGALAAAVSQRAAPDVLMRETLLLTDRPWEQIEAEQRRRARRPFEDDEQPLFPLPELPLTIELPGPPLLLTDRPWAEIEAEQRRLAGNDQYALGRYVEDGPGSGLDDDALAGAAELAALALEAARGPAHEAWERFVRLLGSLDRDTRANARFKRLEADAWTAAQTVAGSPSAEAMIALDDAASAAVDWVAERRRIAAKAAYERKVTQAASVKRFLAKVAGLAGLVSAVQGSLTHSTRHKKRTVEEIASGVRELESEVSRNGYSRADEDRLSSLTAQAHDVARGVTIKPEFSAQAAVLAKDPDDDARQGTEATLVYGGHTYEKVPGFAHPPLYARIDNGVLRLPDEALGSYEAAMRIGKIPANEQGASGVKQKPLHWEIKLIAKTAKRLMGDSDLRIVNNRGAPDGRLQKTSRDVEIRYLVFDTRHNAH